MKKFFMGFLVAAVLFSSAGVYAATNAEKTIKVLYNIKAIKFDGVTKNPSAQPFQYNGSTYVPIRFVAETFGKDVKWDSKTQSVLINTKTEPTAYLGGDVQYMKHTSGTASTLVQITYNGKSWQNGYSTRNALPKGVIAKDNVGNEYKHYIVLSSFGKDTTQTEQILDFPVKSGFTKFNAKLAISDIDKNTNKKFIVEFLLDGKVAYSKELEGGSFPEDVSFNVGSAKKLSIRMAPSLEDDGHEEAFGIVVGNPVYKK